MLRERILLYDQEPDHAELLEYNLLRAGYEVKRAESEGQLIEEARSFLPQLVMIGNCSSELLKASLLKDLAGKLLSLSTSIVSLTTDPHYQEREYFQPAVIDACLVLPIKPRQILAEIGKLLKQGVN